MNLLERKEMRVLFKYPSRARFLWFQRTLALYYKMMSGKHPFQFVITLDEDDPSMNSEEMRTFLQQWPNLSYSYGHHETKVDACNADMEGLDWDIFVLVSDDMIPVVKGYDDIIVSEMKKHFPDTDGALHFNDGFEGRDRLITLSIMGRKLYERFDYVYNPNYKSFFCDKEFTEEVYKLGLVVYIPQVIIKHEWRGGPKSKDALYRRNSAMGKEDKATYCRRKAANFPK